jgi:hypothetical protein
MFLEKGASPAATKPTLRQWSDHCLSESKWYRVHQGLNHSTTSRCTWWIGPSRPTGLREGKLELVPRASYCSVSRSSALNGPMRLCTRIAADERI